MDDIFLPKELDKESIQEVMVANVAELSAIEQQVNDASKRATEAREKAENIRESRTNWLVNKASIIDLKNHAYKLSEALESVSQAQLKMQKYQTALTKFMALSFEISISSVAAGDIALEKLQQIVSDNKKTKSIGQETKERIDELVTNIKNQQNFIKKMDDIKKKIAEQESRIASLSQKLDDVLSLSEDSGSIDQNRIIINLKSQLTQITEICAQNNETISNCFNSLDNYLVQEVSLLKKTIIESGNITGDVINNSMCRTIELFKQFDNSYAELLEMLSKELLNIKSELETIDRKNQDLLETIKELSKQIEDKHTQNTIKAKRTNIVLFSALGLIGLLVIACFIVLLTK